MLVLLIHNCSEEEQIREGYSQIQFHKIIDVPSIDTIPQELKNAYEIIVPNYTNEYIPLGEENYKIIEDTESPENTKEEEEQIGEPKEESKIIKEDSLNANPQGESINE